MTGQIVTLGADIEEFIVDNNGQIIPVCGLVGGSKHKPLPTPNGAVSEDNVAIEYNPLPASSEDEFVHNVLAARQDAKDILAKLGFDTIAKSSHHFTQQVLMACGPKAMTFGCAPDLSLNGNAVVTVPSAMTTLRTAAGHIHFGCGDDSDLCRRVVSWCDVLMGLPSVLLDDDKERRTLYGRAGRYRLKCAGIDAYNGVEYRTLGNWWVNDENTIRWIWRQSQTAYNNAKLSRTAANCSNIIDSYDSPSARRHVQQHGITMP